MDLETIFQIEWVQYALSLGAIFIIFYIWGDYIRPYLSKEHGLFLTQEEIDQRWHQYWNRGVDEDEEKRIADQELAHSKKCVELISFRTYELAKLTKNILDGVDLKNLTDVLPILESQAFQGKAVNEFLDDLSAQFRDAIVERVNASASEQNIKMDYSDARISAKVDDLVATCIEMGRPILLTKLEIKDAGNFDGVNKSKIGKTKKWEGA